MIRRERNSQLLRDRIGLGEPPTKVKRRYDSACEPVFDVLHLDQGVDISLAHSTRSLEVVRLVVHYLVANHPSPGTRTPQDLL